jgi:hypothetical protein
MSPPLWPSCLAGGTWICAEGRPNKGTTNVEAAPASVVLRPGKSVSAAEKFVSQWVARCRSRSSSRVVTACHHGGIMAICLGGNTAAKSG